MFSAQHRRLRSTPVLCSLLMLFLSTLACSRLIRPTATPTAPPRPTERPTLAPRPTPAPTATEPLPAPTSTTFPGMLYAGIEFRDYESVAPTNVTAETIPAVPATAGGPPWGAAPEYIQFTFSGYVLAGTFHQPRIMVYPANEYAAVNDAAKEVIESLRRFLASKPTTAPDSLPFLPLWNAAQMLRTQMAYLDFQNGTGVRFLTQYGQAAAPINNYSLFYSSFR